MQKSYLSKLFILAVTIFSIAYSTTSRAHLDKNELSEEEVRSLALSFVPGEFKQETVDGQPATLGSGVGYQHVRMKLKNQRSPALVLLYSGLRGKCELRLLVKKGKNWSLKEQTVLQYPDQISFCREIEVKIWIKMGKTKFLSGVVKIVKRFHLKFSF